MLIMHISGFYSEVKNFGASTRFRNLLENIDDGNQHVIVAPNYKKSKHRVLRLTQKYRIVKLLCLCFYFLRYKPDVIVSDLLPTIRPLKSKLIYLIHDVRIESDYQKAGLRSSKFVYRQILRSADKIVTVSDFSKAQLQKYFSGKIDVVCNGVEAFELEEDLKVTRKGLVYIAKHEGRKRIDKYLNICADYYDKTGEVSTLISDYDQNSFSYCKVVSGLSRKKIGSILRSSKYYVSTSEFEGFGMPLVEAASMGCNLAVTDNSAHKEVMQRIGICEHLEFGTEESVSEIVNQIIDLKFDLDISIPDEFRWSALAKQYSESVSCAL